MYEFKTDTTTPEPKREGSAPNKERLPPPSGPAVALLAKDMYQKTFAATNTSYFCYALATVVVTLFVYVAAAEATTLAHPQFIAVLTGGVIFLWLEIRWLAHPMWYPLWLRCSRATCDGAIPSNLVWVCWSCKSVNDPNGASRIKIEKSRSFLSACSTCGSVPEAIVCHHCGHPTLLIDGGNVLRAARQFESNAEEEARQKKERHQLQEEVTHKQHKRKIIQQIETNDLLTAEAQSAAKRREATLIAYPWIAEVKSDPDEVMEKIVNEVVHGEMIIFRVLRPLLAAITE